MRVQNHEQLNRKSITPFNTRLSQCVAAKGSFIHRVPPLVHKVLRSPGQPLDLEARAFMEPRFGHDFSQVRVHTDAKAAGAPA